MAAWSSPRARRAATDARARSMASAPWRASSTGPTAYAFPRSRATTGPKAKSGRPRDAGVATKLASAYAFTALLAGVIAWQKSAGSPPVSFGMGVPTFNGGRTGPGGGAPSFGAVVVVVGPVGGGRLMPRTLRY